MSFFSQESQAATIRGPVSAADATHRRGVVRVALSGSAQNIAIPTAGAELGRASTLGGRFIRIVAIGGNVQIAEAASAVNIAANQVTTIGTGHVQAGATIFDGQPEQWELDEATTHLCFIRVTGSGGFLEFYVSDKPQVT